MKRRVLIILAFVVVVATAAGIVYQRRQSPRAQQEKLVEQFIAILPDSLTDDHVLEIRHLLFVLRERADNGAVKPATLQEIEQKLVQHVAAGRITATNLVRFMAEVGYATYKDDPRYNLSDGSVDHPVLNPSSGKVSMRFDSTEYDSAFWSEYREFEKEHSVDFSDSASGPVRRH